MSKIERISLQDMLESCDETNRIDNIVFSDLKSNPADRPLDYPCVMEGLLLALCLEGNSSVKINLREYKVEPNTLVLIFPDQIFEPQSKVTNMHVKTLFFPLDTMITLPIPVDFDVAYRIGQQSCIKIPEDIMQELITLHDLIKTVNLRKDQAMKKEIVIGLLYTILVEVYAIYVNTEDSSSAVVSVRQEELIKNFMRLLIQHRKEKRDSSFYADKLYVTPKHLSGTLKRVTGRPIQSWINEAVIIEAKSMLKTSNKTVLQISEELHFANPSFFGRYFKQYTGMTPIQYRENG